MERNGIFPYRTEHDTLEPIASNSNDSDHLSDGDNSPTQQGLNEETDDYSFGSKKIRKKRNAYQKIDDDVRVKLLEAVQQRGETLKSAAKKYKINYSSAKSILHTYRREGRILKKSGQEKAYAAGNTQMEGSPPHQPLTMNPSSHQALRSQDLNRMEVDPSPKVNTSNIPKSPNHGLIDNFAQALKLGAGNVQNDEASKMLTQPAQLLNKLNPPFNNTEMPQTNYNPLTNPSNIFGMAMNPATATSLTHLLQGNSLENLKPFENLYMNYAKSPLTGSGRMNTESTAPSTKQNTVFTFDTFSDMVGAYQNQTKQAEDIFVPHPVRFNTAQLLQDKIESKLTNDDTKWGGTLEDAALDTFKSFMDAQLLLQDALKKASYLNSLVQLQKSKPDVSPRPNEQSQNFRNN